MEAVYRYYGPYTSLGMCKSNDGGSHEHLYERRQRVAAASQSSAITSNAGTGNTPSCAFFSDTGLPTGIRAVRLPACIKKPVCRLHAINPLQPAPTYLRCVRGDRREDTFQHRPNEESFAQDTCLCKRCHTSERANLFTAIHLLSPRTPQRRKGFPGQFTMWKQAPSGPKPVLRRFLSVLGKSRPGRTTQ